MYSQIKVQKTTRVLYAEHLVAAGVLDETDTKAMEEAYRAALEAGQPVLKSLVREPDEAVCRLDTLSGTRMDCRP